MKSIEGFRQGIDTISFESTEMCAIDAAFEDPGNRGELARFREFFPETYTEEKTKFFKDATQMSLDFARFRNFIVGMQALLEHEAQILEGKDDMDLLPCGYGALQHKKALESVLGKIKSARSLES